ncbi:MAG: class I SAM-dependent methyltransferase [Pseudomonadota bacterium]
MLWPLWHRASEAKRSDRLIVDPLAVELINRIDYDFQASFGKPSVFHPIRARFGDDLINSFLTRYEHRACVVALGEGLETQYWRLGEPDIPWISVDVPEAITVRERLLPGSDQMKLVPLSALDLSWMDHVPQGRVPFISAMGLLMYFKEHEVHGLLTAIAERFPEAQISFDTIPEYFSLKTLQGYNVTRTYVAPPMPWGISIDDLGDFLDTLPNIADWTVQTYAQPFPKILRLYWLLGHIGPIRRKFAPALAHLSIADR